MFATVYGDDDTTTSPMWTEHDRTKNVWSSPKKGPAYLLMLLNRTDLRNTQQKRTKGSQSLLDDEKLTPLGMRPTMR